MKSIRHPNPENLLKSSIISDAKKDFIQTKNMQYRIIDILGQKSMASVYLVQDLIKNKLFIAKKYKYDLAKMPPEKMKNASHEESLLKKLNCLEKVEWINKDEKLILQPFFSGVSLYNLSQKQTTVSQEQRLVIMHNLMDKLKVIHDLGWIHADLQPSNIIIDFDEKNNTITHVKEVHIVDFDQALPLDLDQDTAYIPMNSRINTTYYGYYFYVYLKLSRESQWIPFTKYADFYAMGGIAQHVLILSKNGMHEIWNHPVFYKQPDALKAFKAGCEMPLFVTLPNKH